MREAESRGDAAGRLVALRPRFQEYVDAFGPHGLRAGADGVPEYHFPKFADPVLQQRLNQQIVEMTQPWRREAISQGGERSARVPTVRLKDRQGRVQVRPVTAASERRWKEAGLIPVWKPGGLRLVADEAGYLWRILGSGKLAPTGHTHLPGIEPWPWVKAACAGCRGG